MRRGKSLRNVKRWHNAVFTCSQGQRLHTLEVVKSSAFLEMSPGYPGVIGSAFPLSFLNCIETGSRSNLTEASEVLGSSQNMKFLGLHVSFTQLIQATMASYSALERVIVIMREGVDSVLPFDD